MRLSQRQVSDYEIGTTLTIHHAHAAFVGVLPLVIGLLAAYRDPWRRRAVLTDSTRSAIGSRAP